MMGRLLGPLEVEGPDGRAALGGPKQRAVLAQLLLRPGRVVAVDHLIAIVWGDDPGDGARHTLHVYVSGLRRALAAVAPGRPGLLERSGAGYRLALDEAEVDALRMERLARRGRELVAAGDAAAARSAFDECLALWRGPALVDFPDDHWARAEAHRLDEVRMGATEDRIDADLALGHHRGLVAEIEALVRAHPLRERLHGRLMLALYRSGRQTDALAAYRRARSGLAEVAGLDPGPELRDLERRILAQDPSLMPAAAAAGRAAAPEVRLEWPGPDGSARTLALDAAAGPVAIGRLPESDILLDWDDAVSRAHAEVLRFAGAWHVVDAGMSRNGTRVNGEPVTGRRILADGDVITVGATDIRVRAATGPRTMPPETRIG